MFFRADSSSLLSWLPYAPLILLLLALFYNPAIVADLILLFGFMLLRSWRPVFRVLRSYNLWPLFLTLKDIAVVFAIAQITKWLRKRPIKVINSTNKNPRPLLYPSRITCTRLFPRAHSFSYSYLLMGIPVGWQVSVGGILSADHGTQGARSGIQDDSSCGWYNVDAEDYLGQGSSHMGLDGKLKKFLQGPGVGHEDYLYAYFIASPKFLGYSFNPVSLWYLYSTERELTAMIIEVNNNSDEKLMYLLKPIESPEATADFLQAESTALQGLPIQSNSPVASEPSHSLGKSTRFTNAWITDSHIRSFNSREETYLLDACDPLCPSMNGSGLVDIKLILKSSMTQLNLMTHIASEGMPVDQVIISKRQKLRLLIYWWWVCFVTFPRILREVSELFIKRKLRIWITPELRRGNMDRRANATEQVLEGCFRNYLRYLVESAASPLAVEYTASGILGASEQIIISASMKDNLSKAKSLKLKVLTPLFYSRFVHYAHDFVAFFSEFNESKTIWLSQPSLVPELVLKKSRPPHIITNLVNFLCFKAIQNLRRRPVPIENPHTPHQTAKHGNSGEKSDIRTFRLSAMDGFILAQCHFAEQRKYRTEVLKLFISDRIGFGSVKILGVEIFLLKCLIAWVLAGILLKL